MTQDISQFSTAQLIDEGRALVKIIDEAEAGLKAIESELRSRALAMPHEPLSEGNREGRRATLRDGSQTLTVVFESDLLKTSFDAAGKIAESLSGMLSFDQMDQLFRLKRTYERTVKDGHKFRLQCADLLGPQLAPAVIDLLKDRDRNGIVKSKSTVEWSPKTP